MLLAAAVLLAGCRDHVTLGPPKSFASLAALRMSLQGLGLDCRPPRAETLGGERSESQQCTQGVPAAPVYLTFYPDRKPSRYVSIFCGPDASVGGTNWDVQLPRDLASAAEKATGGQRQCQGDGEGRPSPLPTLALPTYSYPPLPPFNAATAPFAWSETTRPLADEGICVALVKGLTPRQALSLLAPDAKTPVETAAAARRWADATPAEHYGTALEAGTLGDWTVVLEVNGYRAQTGDYPARLSQHGEAVVYYVNVELDSTFTVARRGTAVRALDPVGGGTIAPSGRALPEERGLQLGTVHATSSSLALLQRLTGVTLTPKDVDDPSGRIAVGLQPA